MSEFPELGFYALAGEADSSRDLLQEVRDGEALGLGTVFISERYNKKEVAAQCGAAAAVSETITISTGVTNSNTRHPLVTAGFARTMQSLTGGRFVLGIGRGIPLLQTVMGINHITTAEMEDFAGLMRRLFRGEAVMNHDGPAGRFPYLRLDTSLDEHLRMSLAAFGENTLRLAGRCFDEVILHTYFTDETVVRCVETVRSAAEQAGRDPSEVRVWSCFATVGDHLPYEARMMKTVGRLATYLQGYGELLVNTNRWDLATLQRFREHPVVATRRGAIDAGATTEELEQLAEVIPADWLAPAATGTPEQCAEAVHHQLDLGCDAVIMHGATPAELEPVVAAYGSLPRCSH